MTKKLSPSFSPSKLSFLPETTTFPLFLYTASRALKVEWCLAIKCVTCHYWQKSMDEVPDLLAMIFLDTKSAGNMTLGFTKLAYVLDCW